MKQHLLQVRAYFKSDKTDQMLTSVLRIALGLSGGATLGTILSMEHPSNKMVAFTIFSLFGYLTLEARKMIKDTSFPVEIADHLSALKDLEDSNKRLQRKEKIDRFVSNAISGLNDKTCPIQNNGDQTNQLCHEDIRTSLENVVKDLIYNTHYFVECDCTDFAVGLFYQNIYDPAWKPDMGMDINKPIGLLFKDDFRRFEEALPANKYELNDSDEANYYVQSKIVEAMKFDKFIQERKIFDGVEYNFIFSPVPNVCESCPPSGAFLIVSKKKEQVPADLPELLRIYGQITSNWVSKFNDCLYTEKEVAKHSEAKMQVITMNEKKTA